MVPASTRNTCKTNAFSHFSSSMGFSLQPPHGFRMAEAACTFKTNGIPPLLEFRECLSDVNIKKRQGFSLLCDSVELQSDRTIKKRQGIPLLCEFVECRSDINIKKRQGFSLLCDSGDPRSGKTIKKRQGFSLFVRTLKSSMPSACQPARFSRCSLLL